MARTEYLFSEGHILETYSAIFCTSNTKHMQCMSILSNMKLIFTHMRLNRFENNMIRKVEKLNTNIQMKKYIF